MLLVCSCVEFRGFLVKRIDAEAEEDNGSIETSICDESRVDIQGFPSIKTISRNTGGISSRYGRVHKQVSAAFR